MGKPRRVWKRILLWSLAISMLAVCSVCGATGFFVTQAQRSIYVWPTQDFMLSAEPYAGPLEHLSDMPDPDRDIILDLFRSNYTCVFKGDSAILGSMEINLWFCRP